MVASIIEAFVIVLLILGFINEPAIADFEQKIFSKWRKQK